MIIEYSKDRYRLFFGLKPNGKYYFTDNEGNETPTKEIQIGEIGDVLIRRESQNLFVSNNNDDKQYLLSISSGNGIIEIHDLESGEYEANSNGGVLDTILESQVFSLLGIINDEGFKEYVIIFNSNIHYYIRKFQLVDFSLSFIFKEEFEVLALIEYKLVSGFIMNSRIIMFFLAPYPEGSSSLEYQVKVFDFNLEEISYNYNMIIGSFSGEIENAVFAKCLHIEDNLGIFIYYGSSNANSLHLNILNIESDSVSFVINYNFDIFNFNTNVFLNDLVKIRNEKYIFLSMKENDSTKLKVLLIDIYEDYSFVVAKLFDYNFNNQYTIFQEFSGGVYDGYLAFSSSVINTDTLNQHSIFMIFGYPNATENIMDISEYFMDDNNNNDKNIITALTENVVIENNIFGYEIIREQIKLNSIPNEVLFYNIIEDNEVPLSNGDILNRNYKFKQN